MAKMPDHLPQSGRWTEERIHAGPDQNTPVIVWTGLGLLLMVCVAGAVAWIMMVIMGFPSYAPQGRLPVPLPHLEDQPFRDLAQFRKQKEAMLRGYHWVDRDRGIVRIPLERAMDALAKTPPGHASDHRKDPQ